MSFISFRSKITAPVATGDSFSVSYPAGTTRNSFDADGHHVLRIDGYSKNFLSESAEFSIAFNPSSISITNQTGVNPIPVGKEVSLQLDTISDISGAEEILVVTSDGKKIFVKRNEFTFGGSGFPVVSSGGLADITQEQQNEIFEGSLVTTTTGERYQYSGNGSKTDEASYVLISDQSPDWAVIANKPSVFTPAQHSHFSTEITDFDSAVDARIAAQEAAILEYATVYNFPATGTSNRLYIATDKNTLWRWTGSQYSPVPSEVDAGSY